MTESNFLYHTAVTPAEAETTLQFTMMDTPIASAVST